MPGIFSTLEYFNHLNSKEIQNNYFSHVFYQMTLFFNVLSLQGVRIGHKNII